MSETAKNSADVIQLSEFTNLLVTQLKQIKPRIQPDELSKINVSQAVSLFALVYERIRNAIEYREDHLIRRAAIERIIKRRLMLNLEGKGEAENVIRELLWARYFPNGSLGGNDLVAIQNSIDKYVYLKKAVASGRPPNTFEYLSEFLVQMLTCEIEEALSPEEASKYANFTYFMFQVLRHKIKIEGLSDDLKDTYLLTALEKSFRKSDLPYQRYHLFTLFYKPINEHTLAEIDLLSTKFPDICKKIDETLHQSYVDSLIRYTRKQLPPFLILFSIIDEKKKEITDILTNASRLWSEVDRTCRNKYDQLNARMRTLAIRSFIYIFLTKMIFALILEVPVSNFFFGEVNMVSIIINSIFPPILMLFIVTFFRVPGEENTKNIYKRIINIVDKDSSFETSISYMPKKSIVKKPLLIFGFTIFYSLTFMITFFLIYEFLYQLDFNYISMGVFLFFVSVVTFFSFRIKQVVNQFRLEEKEGILTPLVDFFFMPVLSMGKFFSSELAKLNFFTFIFDFLIEAPFKLIFEVVEEWISFVKKRKEEII